MNDTPELVFVISPAHSGSTLTELLLASHSMVASAGPLKVLSSEKDDAHRAKVRAKRCVCGAATKDDCPFWRSVAAEVRARIGRDLWELDLAAADPAEFEQQNVALLGALAKVSGSRYIVESSKSISRLRRLLQSSTIRVRPLHVVRSARGVVNSQLKRGRSWLYFAGEYTQCTLKIRRAIASEGGFSLSYEHLASQPRQALREVMDWLGLDFEEAQLTWPDHVHHTIAGNNMRFRAEQDIRLDESWRTDLGYLQKAVISWMAMPARARSPRLGSLLAPVTRFGIPWRSREDLVRSRRSRSKAHASTPGDGTRSS